MGIFHPPQGHAVPVMLPPAEQLNPGFQTIFLLQHITQAMRVAIKYSMDDVLHATLTAITFDSFTTSAVKVERLQDALSWQSSRATVLQV